MAVSFGNGGGNGNSLEPIDISEFVYLRKASTLEEPVPAETNDYELFFWNNNSYLSKNLLIKEIGTDQHDNTIYKWYIDGNYVESISGSCRIGSISKPFKFSTPIRVRKSIKLCISNGNSCDYPNNNASAVSDMIPYEFFISGVWEVI